MHQGVLVRSRVAAAARFCLPLLALAGTCAFARAADPSGAPTPAKTLSYTISPDGAALAVVSGGAGVGAHAWVVAIDDGSVLALDDAPLATSEPAWDARGYLRIQVLDRARGVPEMRWIDTRTREVIDSTRDRERMRDELASSASWAALEDKKCADGHVARSVLWIKKDRRLELERTDGDAQVCSVPGIVFHELKSGAERLLVKRDMASGVCKTIARLDESALDWRVSADGRGILLLESGSDRRARVIDTGTGMLVHGPWLVDSACWIDGADGRYVGLTRSTQRIVVDTLRDREIDFGAVESEWPRMVALADGRFVVDEGARIVLRDSELAPVRTLFEHEGALVVVGN